MKHHLPSELLERKVKVIVVGAGGNGSILITQLVKLHHAMLALGHHYGLDVLVIDGDTISEANLIRQEFRPWEVNQYKAIALVNRLNHENALDWDAEIEYLTNNSYYEADIVIGCVDTRKARLAIKHACKAHYYLDCGNTEMTGQVVLGENNIRKEVEYRLPLAGEIFPELLDATLDKVDDGPSCSLAEALQKQNIMINTMVANCAVNLLATLFRTGSLSYHGNFINLNLGRISALQVEPKEWERLGISLDSLTKASN